MRFSYIPERCHDCEHGKFRHTMFSCKNGHVCVNPDSIACGDFKKKKVGYSCKGPLG